MSCAATGFDSMVYAHSVFGLSLPRAPGFEPSAYRRRRHDMVPFQAAIIPLMETELFCSLDLGQTQGLTAALEARSQLFFPLQRKKELSGCVVKYFIVYIHFAVGCKAKTPYFSIDRIGRGVFFNIPGR